MTTDNDKTSTAGSNSSSFVRMTLDDFSITDPLEERYTEGLSPSMRSAVAAVRARTRSRTQYALQVLSASQATLEATDALIAASDVLLGLSSSSSSSPSSLLPQSQVLQSTPEACEASDSSESNSSSGEEEAVLANKAEKATNNNKEKHIAEDGNSNSSSAQSTSDGNDNEDDSAETISTGDEDASGSKSTNVMSVELLLKGSSQRHVAVTEHAISGSIISGSFENKIPIPQFITPQEKSLLGRDEMTASSGSLGLAETKDNSSRSQSSSSSSSSSSSEGDEEEDGSGSSEEDESGDSSEGSEASESENITVPSTTGGSQSTTTGTDLETDAYVDELLGEIGRPPQKPHSLLPPSLLPIANQSAPKIASKSPPVSSKPQAISATASKPHSVVKESSNQIDAASPVQSASNAAIKTQSTEAVPMSESQALQQAKPSPPSVANKIPPARRAEDRTKIQPAPQIDDDGEEDSSYNSSSDSKEDESSSQENEDTEESDTGRPSESEPKSSSSDDVEEDDYVEELLSELKHTKEDEPDILLQKNQPLPPQMAAAQRLQEKSKIPTTQSVATATTAAATTITSAPTKPSSKLASKRPVTPAMPIVDQEKQKDEASQEDSSSSDDSTSAGGSSWESSADESSGGNDEDDEYVDELLNELDATKPSTLLQSKEQGSSLHKSIAADVEKAISDDEISKVSSGADSSNDSDIFSTDGEDSDDDSDDSSEEDGKTLDYESSGEYASDEDEYLDDLLHELQAPRAAPPKAKLVPSAPLPVPMKGGFPQPPPDMAPMGLGEGLNLDAIRSELEKVGRAVMTQKSGEAFVARAQILASINQLSSHVPNCVLDFLGKEIRSIMKKKKEKAERKKEEEKKANNSKHQRTIDVNSSDDDMSELSEPSFVDSDEEGGSNVKFIIDASGVDLEGNRANGKEIAEDREQRLVSRTLMRRKSEEALDELFKQAREDISNRSLADFSEDIGDIFNNSNEYGFSRNKNGSSIASFGGSMESSTGSSEAKGFQKFKGRSRAGSTTSFSLGSVANGELPSVSRFECALLFVDISGFTKLSTLLDPESLSKVINSYFQLIVSKIYEFNGDIQKFAGDAIFAEWRCSEKNSMEFCVAAATACASQIVDECSDFPVMTGGAQTRSGEPISSLNVHCALGAGQMIGIHVGDNTRRREYLFLGEPIDQLTWGADLAKHGELVVSPEAFRALSTGGCCYLDFNVKPSETEPAIIAKRSVSMFRKELSKRFKVTRAESAKSRGVTGYVEGLDLDDLRVYKQLMSLYVHPVISQAHQSTSQMKSKSSAQERHREEAELRRVYIMFIHPLITISEEEDFSVDLLNEIMNLTSTQLERYCGHLRQMIVDDKGLVLIGTFGLRGSTFPNMVAERALPATIALHNALQSQLGVDNRIGATFGEVYCGAVGGVKRHEYAVLGPSANLAARLMGNKNNPGILVECNIRRMASRKYAFNALPPVKAKGYADPVPIFEPLSPLERSWGRIQPNFVGREQEIKALMGMARDIVSAPEPHSRLVFVASQSGMGKSTMVAHAIEHIRNFIGDSTRRLVITKHVGKESHSLLPFGMFRSILLDVLANFAASTDDKSHASGVSGFTSQSLSLASLSCRSQGSSTALSLAKSEELLKVLCRELNAPSGFVDHILHQLSGSGPNRTSAGGKAPSMKSMISFMERAFRRCTEETKLVVVALDDVQYIDEFSWKVLRQVFEGCNNVMMICAFDLSRSRDLKVEADFWQVLNQKYRPSGRFVPMELGGLGKEEITQMTMKTLGMQREDISNDLLNEVLIQSGGMPHFANEFLELIKRRQFNEMMDTRTGVTQKPKTEGAMNLGSVPEIILHRIDSFDVAVRNILNIAAVLGKSFTLKEVMAVLKENHDMREDVLEKETIASLETAIHEGILRKEDQLENKADTDDDDDDDSNGNRNNGDGGGDNDRGSDKEKRQDVVYSFYHSIWQSTILSLMLDARKKDVHRKIALSMEKEGEGGSDFAFQMKLLGHWKSSGNTSKLTNLALEVGKYFEEKLAMPSQSIRVYEEALDAWKSEEQTSDRASGISVEALDATDPEDLQHISALHVALGRAFDGAQRNADSALCFHDALKILRVPKTASKITDRSASFPAYFGLYQCVKSKTILEEEGGKRYEQLLIKKFLEDTKHHSEKYHHVHAITCQMDLYHRNGDIAKALGIQKVLYNLYDHVEHNKKLKQTYGSDEAAMSFSTAAIWHWQLGNKEAALDACRHVIGKLMPKTDRSDVHQSFMIMYPVVLVMKDTGVAVQARKHFDRLVVKPFSAFFGEGKSSFFLPVYEPIMMLLHLVGDPDDLDEDTLEEYVEWALDRDRLSFGTLANRRLGVLGRCADSLSAEICFLLAERIEDDESRRILADHGKDIAQEALIFNTEQGMTLAEQQVKAILTRYEPLMAELSRDSDDEQHTDSHALPLPLPSTNLGRSAFRLSPRVSSPETPQSVGNSMSTDGGMKQLIDKVQVEDGDSSGSDEEDSSDYESSEADTDDDSDDDSNES